MDTADAPYLFFLFRTWIDNLAEIVILNDAGLFGVAGEFGDVLQRFGCHRGACRDAGSREQVLLPDRTTMLEYNL